MAWLPRANEGGSHSAVFPRVESAHQLCLLHHIVSPLIEIDGDTAQGTWYLLQTCTYAQGNQAVWGAATYQDRYVRDHGVWKFQHVRIVSHFWTPFEEGWARLPFIQQR
jgi:hypothetical protein